MHRSLGVSEVAAASFEAHDRAEHLARWITRHPRIGVSHMLSLMQRYQDSRPRSEQLQSRILSEMSCLCATKGEIGLAVHAHIAASRRAQRHVMAPGRLRMTPVVNLVRPGQSVSPRTFVRGSSPRSAGIHAMELYVPRHSVCARALSDSAGDEGQAPPLLGALLSHVRRSGPDEDALSIALTAVQRLATRRCMIGFEGIGFMRVASQDLLDRSKSMASELMALSAFSTDVEGIDGTSGLAGGGSALTSCVAWSESAAWDGRYALAVCTDSSSALSSDSSVAVAALIGPHAPLSVSLQDWAAFNSLPRCVQGTAFATAPIMELPASPADFALDHPTSSHFERRVATSLALPMRFGRLATCSELAGLCSLLVSSSRRAAPSASSLGKRVGLAIARAVITRVGEPDVHVSGAEGGYQHDARVFRLLCCNAKGAHLARTRLLPLGGAQPPPEAFFVSFLAGAGKREYTQLGMPSLEYIPRAPEVVEQQATPAADLASLASQMIALGTPSSVSGAVPGVSARPRALPRPDTAVKAGEALAEVYAELLAPGTTADAPLMEAGLDSLGSVEFRNRVAAKFEGAELPETLVFDFPTLRQLEGHLNGLAEAKAAQEEAEEQPPQVSPDRILAALHYSKQGPAGMSNPTVSASGHPVYVRSASFCLPGGSASPTAVSLIASTSGAELIDQIEPTRWQQVAGVLSNPADEQKARSMAAAGLTRTPELFDPRRFGVSRVEASAMDPQQRLVLEHGYAALQQQGNSSGQALQHQRSVPQGSGVAVGITQTEFARILEAGPLAYSVPAATGATLSIASGRVSFVLGLQGPCVSVETACSSALAACHVALRALQGGDCIEHLVAGINLILHPSTSAGLAAAGMLSPSCRSHTFDSRADGFARGEGCVAMALQSSESSTAGMLRGSASQQDGKSASLTAPNGQAQQALLRGAQLSAAVSAQNVCYVEAHGTGTALGDPIEAGSVQAAILSDRSRGSGGGRGDPRMSGDPRLSLASWKANAGHMEPAAGTAGMLHLQLALDHAFAPPNAQLRVLNPHVHSALRAATCAVPTQQARKPGESAIGGVSSFGFSGTIVHAILEAASTRHESILFPQATIPLRRRLFSWMRARPAAASETCRRVYMHASSWAVVEPIPQLASGLIAAEAPAALVVMPCRTSAPCSHPAALSSSHRWRLVVAILDGSSSCAPSLHAASAAFALVKQATLAEPLPSMLFLSRGLHLPSPSAGSSAGSAAAAHGWSGGLVRVLELEYSTMPVLAKDVAVGPGMPLNACGSLCGPDTQLSWMEGRAFVARLRRAHAVELSSSALDRRSVGDGTLDAAVITGGLGGLGLRAATMLQQTHRVRSLVLTSRSGQVAREGQGLPAQLRRLQAARTVSTVVLACNTAESHDVIGMMMRHEVAAARALGLLHAAGIGDKGLLRDVSEPRIGSVFAPKAMGAFHQLSTATAHPIAALVMFSSVAAGLGQVGQGIYAAANAHLDSLTLHLRIGRVAARSLQLPYIRGAGMGAAHIDEVTGTGGRGGVFRGLGALALDDYAACLHDVMAAEGAITACATQLPQTHELLIDSLTDASLPRFIDILSVERSATATRLACSVKASINAFWAGKQAGPSRQAEVELLVTRTVSDLTTESLPTADTPLMEAGVDSLAATELSSRLRALTGLALSPTLVFEQPTARAISSHLLEQAGADDASAAGAACAATAAPRRILADAAAPVLSAAVGRWPGANAEAARAALLSASGDAVGRVPASQRWSLAEAIDMSELSASQRACAEHGGFIIGAERFDNAAFRVSSAEAEAMDPQQRVLLETAYMALHGAMARRATLTGGDGGVFVGIERPDWALLQAQQRFAGSQSLPPSAFAVTGDTINVASGRISFALGLQGPCSSVDTACSSALSALHGGAHAVAASERWLGVSLAVSLKLTPLPSLGGAAAGMLSVAGRCRTFDRACQRVRAQRSCGSASAVHWQHK